MISFDFECANKHRFEGFFNDHAAFEFQLSGGIIRCPLCESVEIKRIFTGCSIQSRPSVKREIDKRNINLFEMMRLVTNYVHDNFENVGGDLASTARAMHYGIEEKRNVFGQSTPVEIKELSEEGIDLVPLPDLEKINN